MGFYGLPDLVKLLQFANWKPIIFLMGKMVNQQTKWSFSISTSVTSVSQSGIEHGQSYRQYRVHIIFCKLASRYSNVQRMKVIDESNWCGKPVNLPILPDIFDDVYNPYGRLPMVHGSESHSSPAPVAQWRAALKPEKLRVASYVASCEWRAMALWPWRTCNKHLLQRETILSYELKKIVIPPCYS